MKCTLCYGSGEIFAHVLTRNPKTHGFQMIKCDRCNGSGVITQEQVALIARGKKLREDRKKCGLTLRQEAKRLGISVVELSELERGVFINKT